MKINKEKLTEGIEDAKLFSNRFGSFSKSLGKNTQNVFRWLFATTMAHNIVVSRDMKMVLLRNRTNEMFITSD